MESQELNDPDLHPSLEVDERILGFEGLAALSVGDFSSKRLWRLEHVQQSQRWQRWERWALHRFWSPFGLA